MTTCVVPLKKKKKKGQLQVIFSLNQAHFHECAKFRNNEEKNVKHNQHVLFFPPKCEMFKFDWTRLN